MCPHLRRAFGDADVQGSEGVSPRRRRPANIEKYGRVGRDVRRLMRELTPLVEPISIDEAFLDLSGTERLHHAGPATTLVRFARRIEDEIGITVSVGLSYNKFLAKIPSDLDKPRGFSIIGRAET